jgi:hypothetical protein
MLPRYRLPVWTPATTEAFATYGTTDQNGVIMQPVHDAGRCFRSLAVRGDNLVYAAAGTDRCFHLSDKLPVRCSNRSLRGMISIAAMRDVLHAFKAKDMPTAKQLDQYFARDVEILQSRQRDDGSFGLWKRDKERYEYPS